MNNSVGTYGPKTRVYITSMTLINRLVITIGTFNLGYLTFRERVFKDLGLLMNTDTTSFLIVKDNHRTYRKNNRNKLKRKQEELRIKTNT